MNKIITIGREFCSGGREIGRRLSDALGFAYYDQEVIVASFSAMQRMDWQDFITQYLARDLGAVHIVAGHDFHFGYMGKGNPDRLRDKCAQLGLGCDIVGRVEEDGITVSSTYIRGLITQGEMERACRFLGHPHLMTGTVVHGKQLGRTLGIPTANLDVPHTQAMTAPAVYATSARLLDGDGAGEWHMSVTSFCKNPTFDGSVLTLETHIMDFSGDIYGRELEVRFLTRLRQDRRFDGLDALIAQLHADMDERRALPL